MTDQSSLLDSLAKPPPPPSELDEEIDRRYAAWLLSKAVQVGECLECHFTSKNTGYCQIRGGENAHRFIYRVKKGPIIKGLIMHTCDNRRCINEDHLLDGTPLDNQQDMANKGRRVVGFHSREPNDILKVVTKAMFARMQEMEATGWTQREIGQEFNIAQTTVRMYLNGTRTPV